MQTLFAALFNFDAVLSLWTTVQAATWFWTAFTLAIAGMVAAAWIRWPAHRRRPPTHPSSV